MNEIQIQNLDSIGIESVGQALSASFLALRSDAIMDAMKIKSIQGAPMESIAIDALSKLQVLIRGVESTRIELKRKPLDLCRKIDAAAHTGVDPLISEEKRIKAMLGAYAVEKQREADELERQRRIEIQKKLDEQRAAEAARVKAEADRVAAADRARVAQEAVEAAATAKEKKAANAELLEAMKAGGAAVLKEIETKTIIANVDEVIRESAPIAPSKPSGSKTKFKLSYEVTDMKAFYAAFPAYVDLTEKKSMVNALISTMAVSMNFEGIPSIPGLRVFKDANVTTTKR